MSYEIRTIDHFDRQAKRLAKHYPSFRKDFEVFLDELTQNPLMGTDLGGGIRKVRMSIASKGKGKRGGARVITYVVDVVTQIEKGEVILLSIYDKSERSSISDQEIKRLKEMV